jgi:peptide-methionine (S)-S-oxide reductase
MVWDAATRARSRPPVLGPRTVRATFAAGCFWGVESVEVIFDPARVSYRQLLDTFWHIHNPTSLNRQGWDLGSQYRSAIFVHDPEQERLALATRDSEQESLVKPIVTEIIPATTFYRAEEYHQRYFERSGYAACGVTIEVPATR